MFKKSLSLALATVITCALSGTALAATPATTVSEKEAQQRKERLKTNLLKLADDARAERDAPLLSVPQAPTTTRNNLSTGAKVAIGVGVAVAVIAVIVIVKARRGPDFGDGRIF